MTFSRFSFLSRYALKELFNNRFFSIFFAINLWLGLVGFVFIGNISVGVDKYFNHNLKKILNGDLQISSRQPLPQDLSKKVKEFLVKNNSNFEITETVSLFSMVNSIEQTALFNVRGVDANFNLYSDFSIQNGKVNSVSISESLLEQKGIWLDKESMRLLQVKVGNKVKIGNTSFTINQTINRLPQMGSAFSAFVPTVYIHRQYIKDTGLLLLGSRASSSINIKLPNIQSIDNLKQGLISLIYQHYPNAGDLRVRSLKDASERLDVLLEYITGFLNIVSLIALFLSGIGTAFLFRNYALKRLKSSAIAACLGLSNKQSNVIILIQLLLLASFAGILAILFGGLLSYIFSIYFSDYIGDFEFVLFNFTTAFAGLLIAIFSALLFSLPTLLQVRNIKPIVLLKSEGVPVVSQNKKQWFFYLPGLIFFWLVATYLTNWIQGSFFILVFCFVLLLLIGCVSLICDFSLWLSKRHKGLYKMALRQIARHRNATISGATSIALGVFLIAIIPQISMGISDEIKQPKGSLLPNYFLIDIQEEQLEGLEKLIIKSGLRLDYISPLVRGRLTHVNNVPVGRRYDNPDQKKLGLLRAFNLSYRQKLLPSEKIVTGNSFDKYSLEGTAQVSIEEKFAKRNNLKIGDLLVFDIQGVPIEGIIQNLRSVKWNSFQPNFFVLFQTQALILAPKTYIANIPDIEGENKFQFRKALIEAYPNISAIDIQKLIDSTLNISAKALELILFLATITFLSGMMVVFSISIMRAYEKKTELSLLKTLGMSSLSLQKLMLIEFSLPAIIAVFIGVILSIAVSFAFSYLTFERIFDVHFNALIIVLLLATLLIMLMAWLVGSYVSKIKPLQNLRDEQS
jgi:putative ABC transport system permease protein